MFQERSGRGPIFSIGCRPILTRHNVETSRWTGPPLRIALISDLHICWPWVTPDALARVVAGVNALEPDLILLPGDFLIGRKLPSLPTDAETIAQTLAALAAPLGVFASLGNHDWKDCRQARRNDYAHGSVTPALEAAGIPVLSNQAVQIRSRSEAFWLVGFDSQQGHGSTHRPHPRHDPDRAFDAVPEGASVVLMAHEPDYFMEDDPRVALQVSGHTHAGQMNLFGWRPLTPSRYGGRLAYGAHARGDGRLIVSAGLGYSGAPLRIGAPPEVTLVYLSGQTGDGGENV
ncbi:metallophosphoesterase [Roseobacter sp. HKCCD5914]|uniref:metallophosphoesterase n=1 Tax=Roseobacter sp. HKCCD6544 TaxID=2690589 RepID=UPI0019FF1AE0|nr:metallophosphoesterase [Roseobacter sp. HKCCD5914]